MFACCEANWHLRIPHNPNPIRALAEAQRISHNIIIEAAAQPCLLLRFPDSCAQRGVPVTELRMPLGETPDPGFRTAKKQKVRLAICHLYENNSGTHIVCRIGHGHPVHLSSSLFLNVTATVTTCNPLQLFDQGQIATYSRTWSLN